MPVTSHVLVVGAGPVGLTAAHELARRGLRVRLIDGAPGPAVTSRAVAVHPRTLETFDQMGIAAPFVAAGRQNRAFTMFARGTRLVRLEADYSSMPTRYPYSVILEQTRTEALLREAVGRLGVRVEWGTRLTSLEQEHDGVRARLEHTDGSTEEYTAGWLVGCDGGHSTVRKQLRLPLIGESSETWELADAPVTADLPQDTIYWVHTGRQALMMVPYSREGHWRLLDTAPGTTGTKPGGGAATASVAERFGAKLGTGLGREVRVGEPEWTSVFTFQQRMVPRMHDGRVFVCGDAAHVHSPASGQGMNTGVQEAYNLAWKLAMADRGEAGRELLHTYSEERVPVGEALLGSTRKATFLVQFKNTVAGFMLPVVFTFVRNIAPLRRAIQRKVLGSISGLRLGYPESTLTTQQSGGGTLEPGTRAAAAAARHPGSPGADALRDELRDVRWTLLVAADGPPRARRTARAVREAFSSWLSVRTLGGPAGAPGQLPDPGGRLRATLGLAPGAWVLIRPDGYTASGGAELTTAALERALAPLGRAAVLARAAALTDAAVLARMDAPADAAVLARADAPTGTAAGPRTGPGPRTAPRLGSALLPDPGGPTATALRGPVPQPGSRG
ncbi:FAD-dependent oxidoreductase [Streptomyces sp. NPDC102402]|uniref:FAD-dependent oxidoreductase n=1 Tax=Streptomyces sp. NPDC102402 TaxID=3366169 RepID=UPI00380383B9